MATTDRLQVSVKWGGKTIIHSTFYRFDISWLRRTTARELHVWNNSGKALITSQGFIRDLSMCAICANTSNDVEGGKIDDVLKTTYITELPICDTCKRLGAKTLVGRHKHNGRAIQERAQNSHTAMRRWRRTTSSSRATNREEAR